MSNRWQRHRNQRYSHPELPGRQYQEAHGIAFQAKTGSVFLILGRCPKLLKVLASSQINTSETSVILIMTNYDNSFLKNISLFVLFAIHNLRAFVSLCSIKLLGDG